MNADKHGSETDASLPIQICFIRVNLWPFLYLATIVTKRILSIDSNKVCR